MEENETAGLFLLHSFLFMQRSNACIVCVVAEQAVEQGSFAGYTIAWPGRRLSSTVTEDSWALLPEAVGNGYVTLDASHVYFLQKRVRRGDSDADIETLRLTALRLSTGEFMPHSRKLFPHTMSYATPANVPIRLAHLLVLILASALSFPIP